MNADVVRDLRASAAQRALSVELDAARWRAYVRFMLSNEVVGPRIDLSDVDSFNKLADELITLQGKKTNGQ